MSLYRKRNQGRPMKRYKDNVKANLQGCNLEPKELVERASYWPRWRITIHVAAITFEDSRRQNLTAAKDQCHTASSAVITTSDFQFHYSSRLYASGVGFAQTPPISQMRGRYDTSSWFPKSEMQTFVIHFAYYFRNKSLCICCQHFHTRYICRPDGDWCSCVITENLNKRLPRGTWHQASRTILPIEELSTGKKFSDK